MNSSSMPVFSETTTARPGGSCARAKQRGHDLLLDIDVQGAAQVKEKLPEAVSIFILPPDRDKLEWRLRNRGLDPEEVIRRRLDTARREIENYSKYDYILVNNLLEQSADELKAIVLAERIKRSGKEPQNGRRAAAGNRRSVSSGTGARSGAADSGFLWSGTSS